MNAYEEMKCRHQQEAHDFPMAFAFSESQFDKGMRKLGLNPTDTDKIYKLGDSGGFFLKSDADKLHAMLDRHKRERDEAVASDKTGKGYIYQMFCYELEAHEYDLTEDLEDTLDAIDLTMEVIKENKALKRGLDLAIKSIKKRSILR
jgi:hypothetical protein